VDHSDFRLRYRYAVYMLLIFSPLLFKGFNSEVNDRHSPQTASTHWRATISRISGTS